jgi:hypothetical protein
VTVYKANPKKNIYYTVGFIILLGLTISFSSKLTSSAWILLITFFLIFIVFNLMASKLNTIQLDKINNTLILIHKNYVGIEKTFKYDLRQIEFTYKIQATSFRGGVKNVCTIYFSEKKIFQLVSDDDNWSDYEIRNFVCGLIDSNVKKKFIGYDLKDVEI